MSCPIPVLYEDNEFIAFCKPAGLLVIPAPRQKKTLTFIVNNWFSKNDDPRTLHPCHRLDRDTSGVILYAKGKRNQKLLMEEFRQQRIAKEYVAIVQGRPGRHSGKIRLPVQSLERRRHGRSSPATMAVTHFCLDRTHKHFSRLRLWPKTGRTNQIRIHLSGIGLPILGDRKYNVGRRFLVSCKRTALHARQICWKHPVNKKRISVQAPFPDDFLRWMGQLKLD